MSTPRWDETWHRLREWTNGHGPSERLAAQILLNEHFEGLDPSHPLGGKDGGRDAVCTRDGKQWILAVYFPRGQKDFAEIKSKFLCDQRGARKNKTEGIAFVTNQEIRLAERKELTELAAPMSVDLYHLERLTTILDSPVMATVRKQFLKIDDGDERTLVLGGKGGNAPGSGGGGGAALGHEARGGDGGRGGDIRLAGEQAKAPGGGGGGGGAMGEGASAGEGGQGGEIVIGVFDVKDLPDQIPIKIGHGGRGGKDGGDGEDGEDTCFGDLLRATGGKGGRAGRQHASAREVVTADLRTGLHVSSVMFAEAVQIRDGLMYLLGAGWENFGVPTLPFEARWPLVCTISMGALEPGIVLDLWVLVADPDGVEVARQKFIVFKRDDGCVSRPNCLINLQFPAHCEGVWMIKIVSGNVELARLPIEIQLRPQ